jgi:RNA-binding protein YlmH
VEENEGIQKKIAKDIQNKITEDIQKIEKIKVKVKSILRNNIIYY